VRVLRGEGHPVRALFDSMDESVESYPTQMVPVPWRDGVVEHTSFFPGGYGLVKATDDDLPTYPGGKIMVVGNDWGNEVAFYKGRKTQTTGTEGNDATWRGSAGINNLFGRAVDYCFFTNAFMGLRKGTFSVEGECPGRRDATFKRRCRDFLREQIRLQKPRLILTLGRWVPDMLSVLAPRHLGAWKNDKEPHWNEIDAVGPLHKSVAFDGLPQREVVVCALTHPSRASANYRRRSYGSHRSEMGLLKAALEAADLAELTAFLGNTGV